MKHLLVVFPVRVLLPLVFLLFLTGAAGTYQVTGTVVNEQGTGHLQNAADDLIDTAESDAEGGFLLSYERQPTSADPEDEWPGAAIPSTFKLGASYPNPVNPQTTVPFYAPEQTSAVIGETSQSDEAAQSGGTAQSDQVARLGDGSQENPYLVANPQQLENVREHRESHFRQIADIDLTGFSDEEEGWDPIGSDARRFRGSYDGDDFQISGLYINRPDRNNIGLFASLEDADIRNLSLLDVDITECYAIGDVVGIDDNVGGLIGYNRRGEVLRSYAIGTVTGSENIVGGLIGLLMNGNVKQCYAHGNVSGVERVGGLVGDSRWRSVVESYSVGQVTGQEDIGGLIGADHGNNYERNYYDKDTSGMNDVENAIPLSTVEMQHQESFENWDFDTVWSI